MAKQKLIADQDDSAAGLMASRGWWVNVKVNVSWGKSKEGKGRAA